MDTPLVLTVREPPVMAPFVPAKAVDPPIGAKMVDSCVKLARSDILRFDGYLLNIACWEAHEKSIFAAHYF